MLRAARFAPSEKWKPTQCIPLDTAVFQEVSGTASQEFAKHIVKLIGPFPPGSVIHDNAAGTGVVSKEVIEVAPPDVPITIHATDLSEVMVDDCQALAVEKGWTKPPRQMTSQIMAMQDLTFADKTFTHSIMNFAMFAMDREDAGNATAHIYRTLRDDGIAVITTWEDTATGNAMQATHEKTRSTTTILPVLSRSYWGEHSHIRKVLTGAGFSDDKIEIEKRYVDIKVKDMDRWSNIMWTLIGRPVGGWQEGDEEKWGTATAFLREQCRKSKDFRTTADGESRIRNWVNVIIARK
jgi:ubiquinone/menaquinone biosynthesis C-methylase UbiE